MAVFCGFSPRTARAWDFDEHTRLGSSGYSAACERVAAEGKLGREIVERQQSLPAGEAICDHPSSDALVRWCLACHTFTAALYGQAVAVAGDHVGTPEELMSAEGQEIAANLTDYTFLALVNWNHFHPEAPRAWRRYHEQALLWASGSKQADSADPTRASIAHQFEQAFFTSAFADHFLQDAFSAGHAGFNRPSSGAVASKAFHDAWNSAGRVVKSPSGECWLQYGDGNFDAMTSFAQQHVYSAESAAAYDLIATFVTRTRVAERETHPLYFVPTETTADALPESVRGDPFVGRGPSVLQTAHTRQRSGLNAAGTSCTVPTISIDGISNPSRVNGGLDPWLVTSTGRDIVYGAVDFTYEDQLADFMRQPFYWVVGAAPLGWVARDNGVHFAPGVMGEVLLPPLYLGHGVWRQDLGLQARGYVFRESGGTHVQGYGGPVLRGSLEAANFIVRLQAGPTFDFSTGQVGVQASLGIEVAHFRWITGGGSLVDF